jgi:hypothetical protein
MRETCRDFFNYHGKDFPEFGEWLKQMERRFGNEAILIASKAFENRDSSWREILEFGKRNRRDYWKSTVWWKFLLKRLVGLRATERIQIVEDAVGLRLKSDTPRRTAWYDHGMRNGWWPQDFRIACPS